METKKMPEKPFRVRLALGMLYLSLGLSVIRILAVWLYSGLPGPVEYWSIGVLMMITLFHAQAYAWIPWVGYGNILTLSFAPIAIALYIMIGKGKNWARRLLLLLVVFETLDLMVGMFAGFFLSASACGGSRLNLSTYLTSPIAMLRVLKIIAVILLFGKTSSDWFKAVKTFNRELCRTVPN